MLTLAALPQSVFGLLNIDGTRNQVFVFGHATFGWDSNVFADRTSRGDYTYSASTGLELKRRAGIIAVNATATLDYLGFEKYTDQSSWNPSFAIEFNKTTGRTTGAFTVRAYRSNRADSAVNLRTTSWNFPLGLNVKYPVNDKYYLTSTSSYLSRRFSNATGSGLSNYVDISEAVDLFYVWTSKLDLVGGYRIRYSDTDLGSTTDHAFSFGASGGLLAKLNGSVRFNYQLREMGYTGETFDQFGVSAALTWNATRKFTLSTQVTRDFNTAATGVTVDSLSGQLRGNYVFTRRFSANAGVGYGRNVFLGRNQPYRRDDFFSWDAGATFAYSEHFIVSGSYNYLHNWSTLAFSDFVRQGVSVDISSRF